MAEPQDEHDDDLEHDLNDDSLESRMRKLKDKDIKYTRHGFYAGISVFVWVAFWDLANRHQDNWRFQVLSWACMFAAIWASANM